MTEEMGPDERRRYDEELTGYTPEGGEHTRGSCLAVFALWLVVAAIIVGVMTWAAIRAV